MAKIIPLFPVHEWVPTELDVASISRILGGAVSYVFAGRWALYHCLKAFNLPGNSEIILPTYSCSALLTPLKALNLKPVFCDIDTSDLNLSVANVEALLADGRERISAVIAPSLYGNPAALDQLETICLKYGVLLIDDAAQAFGSSLKGKFVGSYGGAGFFSFSPGKPTAGHCGGFFRVNRNYSIERTHHGLVHRALLLELLLNRIMRLPFPISLLSSKLASVKQLILQSQRYKNDDIADFEKRIFGGIIAGVLSEHWSFRKKYYEQFLLRIHAWPELRPITAIRGESYSHKLVVQASSIELSTNLRRFLSKSGITTSSGYALLNRDSSLKNALEIENCVVELPIVNNDNSMQMMFELIDQFFNRGAN